MARNFFRIFTENNPVMGYSKTFFIPEAKGLNLIKAHKLFLSMNRRAGGLIPCVGAANERIIVTCIYFILILIDPHHAKPQIFHLYIYQWNLF